VELIVDELNIRLLKAVQDGLRLTKRLYQALEKEMDMSEIEVIGTGPPHQFTGKN
jgi:hypothetical protein